MTYFLALKPAIDTVEACFVESELIFENFEKKIETSQFYKKRMSAANVDKNGVPDTLPEEDPDQPDMSYSWWAIFKYKYCCRKNKFLDLAFHQLN